MSITPRLSFFRNTALALLGLSLIGGLVSCGGGGGTAANPNIQKTENYKVEYVPGAMDAAQGKTDFQIVLTSLNAAKDLQAPAPGPTVTLKPMMYMDSGKNHSAPVANGGACLQSDTLGTYDCTVFYVMASVDGYWELEVMIGDETPVIFEPTVAMAMGGAAMAKQKNSLLATMMGPRTFQVFKSKLTGSTGNHTFELFTSTMETMMSFPAVYAGVTLNPGPTGSLFIDSMRVIVSDTSTFDAEYEATPANNGYWSAANIPGLTNGDATTLYVRVIINGNTLNNNAAGLLFVVPATDPPTPTGAVEYATFTVTPTAPMDM